MTPPLALIVAGGLWALLVGVLPIDSARDAALERGVLWMRGCALFVGAALIATGWLWRRFPEPPPLPARAEQDRGLGQLALLLVVAAALRAFSLDTDLSYDEIVTLVEFVRLQPGELVTTYTSTNNHILFSLLAHASVATFGESAWALRLPAALLGTASLAALWWLAHELAPRRQARLACWLVALSYHHVWFSQNARGYSGMLLWSWLGTAIFLRARRGPPGGSRRLWLAYGAVLALGMYTHLSAVFVFLAHGLVYLGEEAYRMRAAGHEETNAARETSGARSFDPWPLLGFAFGLLLVAQLYAVLLPQVSATFEQQGSSGSGAAAVTVWKNPLWTLLEIVRGLQLGAASAIAAPAAFALAGAGFVSFLRQRPAHAFVLALPTPITLGILLAIGFNIWPRYFLVSLGFAAIVAVRGIFVCATAASGIRAAPAALHARPERWATAACVGMIALSGATVYGNYRFPKQDYSGARDFVTSQAAPSEPVLATGLASYSYQSFYAPHWAALESVEQLDALQGGPRVWLVYSFSTHLRAVEPRIWERIESEFEVVRSFPGTLGDGAVHVLRSTSDTGGTAGPATSGATGARGTESAVDGAHGLARLEPTA